MNRIKYLRDKRDWSQAELARRAGTTQPTINRLETGEAQLTVEWMRRLAQAFGVPPIDLLATAVVAELRDDVEEYTPDGDPVVMAALGSRRLQAYKVTQPVLALLGYMPGVSIVVDATHLETDRIKTGQCVLAHVRTRDGTASGLLLRQFIAPGLLTTNRPGRNVSIELGDDELAVEIRGVVIPSN